MRITERKFNNYFLLITLAGALSRLFHLSKPLWHDEGFSAAGYVLNKPFSELVLSFGNHYFEHLFVRILLIIAPGLVNFLGFEVVFRVLPFASAIAAGVALYLLFDWYFKFESDTAKLGVYVLIQCSELIHWYSHDGRSYDTVLFFAALSTLSFLKMIEESPGSHAKKFLLWSVLGMMNFLSSAFFFGGQLLILAALKLRAQKKAGGKVLIPLSLMVGCVVLTLLIGNLIASSNYFASIPSTGFLEFHWPPSPISYRPVPIFLFRTFLFALLGPIRFAWHFNFPLDSRSGFGNLEPSEVLFLIVAIAALVVGLFRPYRLKAVLVGSIVLPFALLHLGNSMQSFLAVERHFITLCPAIYLLMGIGIRGAPRFVLGPLAAIYLFVNLHLIVIEYKSPSADVGNFTEARAFFSEKAGISPPLWKMGYPKAKECRPPCLGVFEHMVENEVLDIPWNKSNLIVTNIAKDMAARMYLVGFPVLFESFLTTDLCSYARKTGQVVWFLTYGAMAPPDQPSPTDEAGQKIEYIKTKWEKVKSFDGPKAGKLEIYRRIPSKDC
jgi:hypothetical protein